MPRAALFDPYVPVAKATRLCLRTCVYRRLSKPPFVAEPIDWHGDIATAICDFRPVLAMILRAIAADGAGVLAHPRCRKARSHRR
jgi:hypothetical protein